MSYRELGEARILKRYSKNELLKPVRRAVSPVDEPVSWQSLKQTTGRFSNGVRPATTRLQ
ncbi:hypothetical protein MTBPR1_120088 [Candidatus Terasakiella magnetica]|uniref:Uncharacterized protein n=1 Tax=Candidatus Terasakiella magnetica TaxID=1867952 RepID=A0A1C3REX3_9PROT|nr:hypothetical protein [Candidatus Terasakiella magnetica]SCA55782.1 hypothetical protein MTBPR1_120088 [Candidatus Terasakiella magnetica]